MRDDSKLFQVWGRGAGREKFRVSGGNYCSERYKTIMASF